MKIGLKIFSAFIAVILLLTVVGYTAYNEMNKVNNEFTALKEERLKELKLMDDMIINAHQVRSALVDFTITHDSSLFEKIDEHRVKFQEEIVEFEKIPGGAAGTFELDVAEMKLKLERTRALESSILKTHPQMLENKRRFNDDLSELDNKWRVEMRDVLDEMVANATNPIDRHAALHLNVEISPTHVSLHRFLISGEEEERVEYEERIEEFREHLTLHLKEGGDPALFARANATLENIITASNGIFALHDEDLKLKASEEQMLQEHSGLINDISLILDGLKFFVDERMDKAALKLTKSVNDAALKIFYLTVMMLFFGIVLSLVLSRKITTPITMLTNAALELGGGNLDVRAEVKSRDEIEDLAGAFNQMAKDLKTRTGELEKAVGELTGSRVSLLNMMEDMTLTRKELEKAYEELKRSNELKDLFTDIMRHDLLNPIGIVKTYSELALDSGPDASSYEEMQAIKRNAEQAIKLIENATQLSKLESAEKLDYEKLDLNGVFKEVLEDLAPMLKEKNKEVEYKIEGKYHARANPVIRNVFINFISNAIKYTPEGTKVVIDIEDENKDWKVSVKDYGEGIPDENKEIIFERFIKGGKKGIKGTGLGLAIVKRITELHKGKVWIEDNPEGGSIFYVTLPKWKV